ncbi:acetyl-CoA C-acyltransferase [Flavobacterium sedimenticola]|uniref:acetyl-CoA C-acetyltransferase n=1 Tax=Flavobacterium sedimenticola TaxID=3043286 RepID=A0ABT6XNZ8_9FLAO|nr:acetyl-CoA C-acyltransferase [Flavobacterium sedimenticola]MDI9256805.1 acetyl-CoA C-acyltransferase [Flavobacterium sedimenticola]
MKESYIIAAKRTPMGGFLGNLAHIPATRLGSIAIEQALLSAKLSPTLVDSVYFGNVLSANLGQSPARQAALGAGIPDSADCTTINKVCASGMKAVILGAQQIQLGINNIVITGGMENMSRVPHYLEQRQPLKLGNSASVDGLLKDGLTDAYNHHHMGIAAELCAAEFKLSREEQDTYALASYTKANAAFASGKLATEIIPIPLKSKNAEWLFDFDEDIKKVIPEKVPMLPPAFQEHGTVTAANASNLNDGAAAIILASREAITQHQLQPIAKIIGYADAAQAPEWFTTAPTLAVQKALAAVNLTVEDIDFFEINEAYAAVALANQKQLNIPSEKLNAYGGAVAMGHPLGASGARIICTLLSVLQQEKGKYGVAAICNGGGGATAIIIQNLLL